MNNRVKRITRDGIFLALLCVLGMFSIPLGDNIKVSLQFLVVIIIGYLTPKLVDKLIITSLYLLMGLFMPVYAGFNAGITPTFGYVIGFVLCMIPFHFINISKIKNDYVRMALAAIAAILVVYVAGTAFMYWYLNSKASYTLAAILGFSIVPYIPFDAFKIILAILVVKLLPKTLVNPEERKGLDIY